MIVDFDTCTYSDPWYQGLSPLERHLFIYTWTNPHRNVICIYPITERTLSFETGIDLTDIPGIIQALDPKVKFDSSISLLMVINGFKRQYMRTGKVSPKIIAAAEKNLLSLPENHSFVREWLIKYASLGIPFKYPINTVSEGYLDTLQVQGKGTGEKVQGKGDGKDIQGPDLDTPLPPQTQAAWDKLIGTYPAPRGIIEGKAAGLKIFLREPAKWQRWLRNVEHYAAAKAGSNFVHALDNWLSEAFLDYDNPPKPLGEDENKTRSELVAALKNKNNRSMPVGLTPEAEKMFRDHGIPWPVLQQRVISGEVTNL